MFLCELNPARRRDVVHVSFLENVKEDIALVVETRGFDLSAFIKKIDTEKLAFAVLVVPCLDGQFIRAARLDSPFVCVWRQCFYRINVRVGTEARSIGPGGKRLLLLLLVFGLCFTAIEAIARNCCRLWFSLVFCLDVYLDWLSYLIAVPKLR